MLLDGRLRLRCPSHIRRVLAFADLGCLVAPSGRVADLVCVRLHLRVHGSYIIGRPVSWSADLAFLVARWGLRWPFWISVYGAPIGVWAVSLPASGGRAGSPSLLWFPCSGAAAGVGFLPWHRVVAGYH